MGPYPTTTAFLSFRLSLLFFFFLHLDAAPIVTFNITSFSITHLTRRPRFHFFQSGRGEQYRLYTHLQRTRYIDRHLFLHCVYGGKGFYLGWLDNKVRAKDGGLGLQVTT